MLDCVFLSLWTHFDTPVFSSSLPKFKNRTRAATLTSLSHDAEVLSPVDGRRQLGLRGDVADLIV